MPSSSPASEATVTGPTVQAANAAANAQISATQLATQAATESTQSAIQALMGEYTTSLGFTSPFVGEGQNASAQLNYMLGLSPYNPGAAPTMPGVTQNELNSYVNANTTGQLVNGTMVYDYNGLDATLGVSGPNAGLPAGYNTPAGSEANTVSGSAILSPGQGDAIKQAIANTPGMSTDYDVAQQNYQTQLTSYNNEEALYNQYSAKGPATAQDINNIITTQPGYQAQQTSGIQAIQNAASASGALNSSNTLEGLDTFGQTLAGTYYQNYLSNLSGLAGLGANVATAQANSTNQLGENIAGLDSNLGTTIANSDLAAGQAEASSFTSPAANQQIISQGVGSQGGGSMLGSLGGILSGVSSLAKLSTKTMKDTISTPSFKEALNKISSFNIDMWAYKGNDARHIGPYAEEFKEMFGVGDGRTIHVVDALGAVFGLIKELKAELDELKGKK